MQKQNVRNARTKRTGQTALILVLLLGIILSGTYFRTIGTNWDESRHLHPDERFLSDVESRISPNPPGISYFDTARSTLNPKNNGFDFFVYGTLPIFIIRFVGEWTGQVGYDPITLVGRNLSAFMDVLTIVLVFLIGYKLSGSKLGLLASAFYAFAVLPIQQSHFMTVDSFTNTFGMLVVLASLIILEQPSSGQGGASPRPQFKRIWPYLLFGISLGMATASKINAISLALLLPFTEVIRWYRAEAEDKDAVLRTSIITAVLTALISFIAFRICQPYSFNGPGFFGLSLNENWLNSLKSLKAQSSGNVDFPPALQWARRNDFFSLKNLVLWGLGLPLGISAVLCFVGMGYTLGRRRELQFAPIWIWSLLYFLWQGLAWVKAMRYLLLLYPILAVIAAWGILRLIAASEGLKVWKLNLSGKTARVLGVSALILTLLGSALWAFAFTRIYTQPHTRVETSRWIYQNVPGPLNLISKDGTGAYPLPYRAGDLLQPGEPYPILFTPDRSASLIRLTLPSITQIQPDDTQPVIALNVYRTDEPRQPLVETMRINLAAMTVQDPLSTTLSFDFLPPLTLNGGKTYQFELILEESKVPVNLKGNPVVNIENNFVSEDRTLNPVMETITSGKSFVMDVMVNRKGEFKKITLPFVLDLNQDPSVKELEVMLNTSGGEVNNSTRGVIRSTFQEAGFGKGVGYEIKLESPLVLTQPQVIHVGLRLLSGDGRLAVYPAGLAQESSWDDALPLYMDGFVPFGNDGGLYRSDLNLEMYWPDDQSKLNRFLNVLDQSDYVVISSNRQWGTTTRVPERYPLTSAYYRALMGCPENLDIVSCYNRAEPGMFAGKLGFELIHANTSYPRIGAFEFNDQFAEEAFSVYDHPKTLVFRKSQDYENPKVRAILEAVDLSQAVQVTPRQADDLKAGQRTPADRLMLDGETWNEQQRGGSWSDLFDRDSRLNQNQILAVLAFYTLTTLLGLACFPIVRLAFSGLRDQGYAFSRLVGLLLFAWLAFTAGSSGISVTRALLTNLLIGLVGFGLLAAILTRRKLAEFFRNEWRQILVIEFLALVAFAFLLFVRYQNPDLWHPSKGGEKPMDFSYLNAVLKSNTFPAYDPWFAGGYLNYYYFGMVIVGMPIKLLGVVPSVAYNIILPLWYSLLIIASYSVGWNLMDACQKSRGTLEKQGKKEWFGLPFWAGIASALLLGFLGNLGELKLFEEAFKIMGSGSVNYRDGTALQQAAWFLKGLGMYLMHEPMPLEPGSWYWIPSRVIPGDVITEFPMFTFLYADLHAHLIAMPFTVVSVGWGISVLRNKGILRGHSWRSFGNALVTTLIGGLVIGVLKPTNTWDFYTFLVLAAVVLIYTGIKYQGLDWTDKGKWWGLAGKLIPALGSVLVLALSSLLLYRLFNQNFHPGYSQLGIWTGENTAIKPYLTHWGLLIFIIVFWFAWETYQWMAVTKVSDIKFLAGYKKQLNWLLAGVAAIYLVMLLAKVSVVALALPLCIWALLLILIPDQSDIKRLLFFIVGSGLFLSLAVELFYLIGDIGRMNFVFKLYLQAWILLTLACGVGVIMLWHNQIRWTLRTQLLFQIPLIVLVAATSLFPMLGTLAKMKDRMDLVAPHTLDGSVYMAGSVFYDGAGDLSRMMDLNQDYLAIRWLQDNISGTPVILEGQAYEYRWGNRMTIYTGLPSVVGWNYHQRQQRSILRNDVVWNRVGEVNDFYLTQDANVAKYYLEKYEVGYVIVGQLEKAFYPPEGLAKFEQLEGILWNTVYNDRDTTIYQVIRP